MARLIKLSNSYNPTDEDVKIVGECACLARQGKLFIFPTETVYGIMTGGEVIGAKEKINLTKRRDVDTPVAFLVNLTKKVRDLIEALSNTHQIPLFKLMPGPITLVLERQIVNSFVPAKIMKTNDELIGIRIPDYPVLNLLIKKAGGYLLASSANITGRAEPKNVADCSQELWSNSEIELVVDAGETAGEPSAILKISLKGLRVLRKHPRLSEILPENHQIF